MIINDLGIMIFMISRVVVYVDRFGCFVVYGWKKYGFVIFGIVCCWYFLYLV